MNETEYFTGEIDTRFVPHFDGLVGRTYSPPPRPKERRVWKWQDVVVCASELVFFFATLPILLDPASHVPIMASLINFAALVALVPPFHSLKLRFAVVTTSMTAVAWLLIALVRS